MCLAIFKPAKAVLSTEHLFNGYQSNSDGCGFVYCEDNKLHIVKGLFKFKEFLDLYREKEEFPMLIHFRWATHGNTNLINCHPFSMCDGKFAMIHNGVIHICQTIQELSDTGNFAKLVLEPLLKEGIHPSKPSFRFLVENAIGNGNKIALMSSNGNVTIYNEDEGQHEPALDKDGRQLLMTIRQGGETKKVPAHVWYSNACYKVVRQRSRTQHQDELNGYFDGPPDPEVDVCLLPEFTGQNKPKLDEPPGVITGFKPPGFGAKDAKSSAEAIIAAGGASAPPAVRTPGRYPPNNVPANTPVINLNETDKVKTSEHSKAENIKGPVFSAKVELELQYLMQTMHMSREESITALHLNIDDAVVYVE